MRRSLVSWWFVWHRFSLAAWDHAGTLVGWWLFPGDRGGLGEVTH
jgi:hypothetical protein